MKVETRIWINELEGQSVTSENIELIIESCEDKASCVKLIVPGRGGSISCIVNAKDLMAACQNAINNWPDWSEEHKMSWKAPWWCTGKLI